MKRIRTRIVVVGNPLITARVIGAVNVPPLLTAKPTRRSLGLKDQAELKNRSIDPNDIIATSPKKAKQPTENKPFYNRFYNGRNK